MFERVHFTTQELCVLMSLILQRNELNPIIFFIFMAEGTF